MKDEDYYDARDDRLFRYPEARRLDQTRCIAIRAAPEYLGSYAGQVALLTAANLLGRMARRVALDLPQTSMVPPLPWAGDEITGFACRQMRAADPRGEYLIRPARGTDHVVFLGPSGALMVTHGVGWLAYHGPAPSPLPVDNSANPVGAALAVIAAAAQLAAHGFGAPRSSILLNGFDWSHEVGAALPAPPTGADLGALWAVGTGSVGTAILYFLALATRNFSALLFDRDTVKRENVTRSPVFADGDIDTNKGEVAARYLSQCGVADVAHEPVMLHEVAQVDRPPDRNAGPRNCRSQRAQRPATDRVAVSAVTDLRNDRSQLAGFGHPSRADGRSLLMLPVPGNGVCADGVCNQLRGSRRPRTESRCRTTVSVVCSGPDGGCRNP